MVATDLGRHGGPSPPNADTIGTFCNIDPAHTDSCTLGATKDYSNSKHNEWVIGIYDSRCNKIGYCVDSKSNTGIDSELPEVVVITGLGDDVEFDYDGSSYSTSGTGKVCNHGGKQGEPGIYCFNERFDCKGFVGTDQPGTPGLPNN